MVYYTSVGEYKGAYRDIAKRVKVNDVEAIGIAATALSAIIPKGSILIPIPSHEGYPTYNLAICLLLQKIYRYRLCDCLRCRPHESLCTLKNKEHQQGKPQGSLLPSPETMGFYLKNNPTKGNIILIDNVVASGTTAMAAAQLLPGSEVYCIASDETFPKIEGIKNTSI